MNTILCANCKLPIEDEDKLIGHWKSNHSKEWKKFKKQFEDISMKQSTFRRLANEGMKGYKPVTDNGDSEPRIGLNRIG